MAIKPFSLPYKQVLINDNLLYIHIPKIPKSSLTQSTKIGTNSKQFHN